MKRKSRSCSLTLFGIHERREFQKGDGQYTKNLEMFKGEQIEHWILAVRYSLVPFSFFM